jgi:hypothetical protein
VSEMRLKELFLQLLETEIGGVQIYTTALRCVQNDDLKEEWEKYLEQTQRHVEAARRACLAAGVDPNEETPARKVCRNLGQSLVTTMRMALQAGDPEAAELVAAQCVHLAETVDHSNWSLLGQVIDAWDGEVPADLEEAHAEVEHEEDEHLYHTEGWSRELWLQGLGLPAELPPPEEEQHVESALEAAEVKEERKEKAKAKAKPKAK